MLNTQQRFQFVGNVHWRHHIEITGARLRGGRDPPAAVAALIIITVAIAQYMFTQRFQRPLAVDITAADIKIRQALAVATDKKHPVQLVGGSKVVFPVVDKIAK